VLETLTKGFRSARQKLSGEAEITEDSIREAIRDIRISLLEADVEFGVVNQFVAAVTEKAVGEVVKVKVKKKGQTMRATPADHFIQICQTELEGLMGPVDTTLEFASKGPTAIMMVGLQGSGKTTTAGKLARLLKNTQAKKPMLVAADVYRPAAVDQLMVLGRKLDIPVFNLKGVPPPQMCKMAFDQASAVGRDVVIFDTAGRLAIDEPLMAELESIRDLTQPRNVLYVCDAMVGQDAVRTATEFDRRLDVDGIILTKLDGDARGGAALSIKQVTGKPIKFVGMGEGMDQLEEFRPEGMATRILGMGDIVGLMKDFEKVVDEEKAEEDAKKLLKGRFNFNDFLEQLQTVRKMGPLQEVFEKMPFFGDMVPEGTSIDDRELNKVEAIINSMTRSERVNPDIINDSRVERIAVGCGRSPKAVKELMQRFAMARQVMGELGKATGMMGRIPGMGGMAAAKRMGQMGGMGGMMGMGGAPEAGGGGRRKVDRKKVKANRKKAKANRKKGKKKKR
jgi:signal recognition particle subunit SRP54